MAFAGAIPDEEDLYPNDRAEAAGYTTSSADPRVAQAARRPAPVAPEQRSAQPQSRETAPPEGRPVTFRDVAPSAGQAIGQVIDGVKRLFGGGSRAGGIPTEEDAARASDGPRRFALGEGRATPEETRAVDFAAGIDQVNATEGVKNLMRAEAVVNYYLMHGDKQRAEAAGVAMLMAGDQQVKRAGMAAAAAFQQYQQTGDPQDLQNASQALMRAQDLIPDGVDAQIDVDPETGQLLVTTIDADGKEETRPIDANAIPRLLQQAMDGSAYWGAVRQLAQPELGVSNARSAAAAREAEIRRQASADEWDRRHAIEQGDEIAKENRAGERKTWEYVNLPSTTETERKELKMDDTLEAWWTQLQAAPEGPERQQLLVDGMSYRYDNTDGDRREPVAEDMLVLDPKSQFAEVFTDEADYADLRSIARDIAAKNAELDEPGAMEMAATVVTQPRFDVNPDGTVNAGGHPIVFNPQLIPYVTSLHKKYVGP